MLRDAEGAPQLQRVHVRMDDVDKAGWFLHHMPHGMMMIYWGVTDGREQVGQVDARSVTFDSPRDVAELPPPPDEFGYAH